MASTAWVWYRHRFNGHYGHGHLVHGVGCMSIEDAGHGISIGCIDIEYHQNRMPHMASASTAWVYGSGMIHGAINCNNYKSDTSRGCHTRHGHRFNGYQFHRHLVHGVG